MLKLKKKKPLLRPLPDKHMASVADMGDYMPVLMKQPSLRDVYDESSDRIRRPTFGNPFRTDKVSYATVTL